MPDVLLLNRNYQALRIVSHERAFSLLFRDHAEVIHIPDNSASEVYSFRDWAELSQFRESFKPDDEFIRTVRYEIAIPRIIRLLGYDRLPRQNVKFTRRNLFARDNYKCQYCRKRFKSEDLSLDHVIPRSQFGKTTWENIVCCCIKCNLKKGGRTPEQAGMKLEIKPIRPKRTPILEVRSRDPKYRSWKQFVDLAYWNVELVD
jgi:5-methylcytosine-specific restriction endonuclease McrA